MRTLFLFSSQACCLCHHAETILALVAPAFHFVVEKVDIYNDKSLLVRYKTTIPVLKDKGSGDELCWPFDQQRLVAWLEELENHTEI